MSDDTKDDRQFPSIYSLLAEGADDDDLDELNGMSLDEARAAFETATEIQDLVDRYASMMSPEDGADLWQRVVSQLDERERDEIEEEALGVALSGDMTIEEARIRVGILGLLLERMQADMEGDQTLRPMGQPTRRPRPGGKKASKSKRKK